jgi:hypothetical protein
MKEYITERERFIYLSEFFQLNIVPTLLFQQIFRPIKTMIDIQFAKQLQFSI